MAETGEWDDFILRYPGIIVSGFHAKGTVKIKGKWFRIKVMCPLFPKLQDSRLEIQLPQQIKFIKLKNEDIEADWTMYDVMENLPQLQQKYCDTPSPTDKNIEITNANIYSEIAALYAPHEYQLELNDAYNMVRFSKFAEHEQHYLQVELPALRITEHSLPDCLPWEEQLQKYDNLAAIMQQFRNYLRDLQPFYDNFADIDELCYVVQPNPPVSTKHNWRLFVLRDRVFIKLVLSDPFAPISSMSVQIIGPTKAVEELRHTLSNGLSEWDAELDIHKNLLRIFDICYFPMPPGSGSLEADGEVNSTEQKFCNICYSYQLEQGEIPIVSCDNPQCTLIYHAACLKEWFNTLTDGKDFLSVSFGTCPFCRTKISTSFADLLIN